MPASRADLTAYLEKLGIETATVEHPPLFTVEQSQKLRGEIAGGHTKNLFLKDKKDAVFLVVAGEDAEVDMKSLHRTDRQRPPFVRPAGVARGAVRCPSWLRDAVRRHKRCRTACHCDPRRRPDAA